MTCYFYHETAERCEGVEGYAESKQIAIFDWQCKSGKILGFFDIVFYAH